MWSGRSRLHLDASEAQRPQLVVIRPVHGFHIQARRCRENGQHAERHALDLVGLARYLMSGVVAGGEPGGYHDNSCHLDRGICQRLGRHSADQIPQGFLAVSKDKLRRFRPVFCMAQPVLIAATQSALQFDDIMRVVGDLDLRQLLA